LLQRGGTRSGAGRPKGASGMIHREQAERGVALLEEHISPLDIMKAAMLRLPLSNGELVDAQQFAAAVALAPYVHPKLNAVMVRDMTGSAPPPPPMLSVADIVSMARKPAPPVIEATVTETMAETGVDSTDAAPA
jgi:hypothetical protein